MDAEGVFFDPPLYLHTASLVEKATYAPKDIALHIASLVEKAAYAPKDTASYSVRRAITGSFFAALLAGISPEIDVRSTLKRIRSRA